MALTARFILLVTRLGVSESVAKTTAEKLANAYAEPQRHYHTLNHISHMLDTFDTYSGVFQDKRAVELAIWFHDCVYDSVKGAPWNERESIRVWEEFVDIAESERIVSPPIFANSGITN
jgi:predicted metal-dependent HD superfamily phosphohydrolase